MSICIGRKSSLSFVAALLCVEPGTLCGQVIIGRVIEEQSESRIQFADVELHNDRDQVITRATADSLGEFRVRSWHAGKYQLKVVALGYEQISSEMLELATGDVIELTVRLAPNAIPLEPIVIETRARATLAELAMSGYYDRRDSGRRLGLGRFFDRGAIEKRGRRLTDILATIPGVRIMQVPGCPVPLISMTGNNFTQFSNPTAAELERIGATSEACDPASVCRANVYIDGVQMQFDETISIDQTVPLDWIEAIEVYRRASEVPAEFLSRANCGVVAIWTRRG